MKTVITLFFALFLSTTQAKFASWVPKIPCDKLTLKVKSCKQHSFSNRSKLTKKQLTNKKDMIIEKIGSVVVADIEKMEPVKCHAKQDMDLKRYTKREFKIKKFFVNGLKCKKGLEKLITKRINFFCDTPGAKMIEDCFVPAASREAGFVYTEWIK